MGLNEHKALDRADRSAELNVSDGVLSWPGFNDAPFSYFKVGEVIMFTMPCDDECIVVSHFDRSRWLFERDRLGTMHFRSWLASSELTWVREEASPSWVAKFRRSVVDPFLVFVQLLAEVLMVLRRKLAGRGGEDYFTLVEHGTHTGGPPGSGGAFT